MLRAVFSLVFLLVIYSSAQADEYYHNYEELRDNFAEFTTHIHKRVDETNKKFVKALNAYKNCSSNGWRILFVTAIADLDRQRLALEDLKRNALERAGEQNNQWLNMAREHNISSVRSDQSIEDFVIWYKSHIDSMRIGPFQELESYILGYEKLSEAYRRMASACEGKSGDSGNFDLIKSGIRGLIDSITPLMRQTT